MEKDNKYEPKLLSLDYEEFEGRGETIENMMIDKYVVSDLIGMGTYGSVYRGMDDVSKRQVAVKLIDMRKIKADKNEVVRKIKLRLAESEPRLMYMCDSPYLLKCFDVYENEDLKVLIIEYCNGSTLQAEIDDKKSIPEKEAWIIVKHIMNGLMVLHSHKIVHRDLKADNIMSHNGTYKIIDFGFSKKLQIAQESAEIKNTSLGTITTMAPEVMGRKPYGLKADIWSIGIIFFQMIYGQYPYDSTTAPQMYREIQVKKLFNKETPFKFNGFTPSKEAYEFLRFTVVVESEKRPGWREVADYPNIKNIEEISQRFIPQCDVVVDNDANLDYKEVFQDDRPAAQLSQEQQPHKYEHKKEDKEVDKQKEKEPVKGAEKQREKDNRKSDMSRNVEERQSDPPKKAGFDLRATIEKDILEKERQQRQREEERWRREEERKQREDERKDVRATAIRSLNKEELRRKEGEINKEEEREYNWTKEAHLECLKTKFVFREIINPMELHYSTSQTHDRRIVELFYLLSARCFNNMSIIHDEIDDRRREGKDAKIINNLSKQVSQLYDKVQKRFQLYSEKLTKKENEKKAIIIDWFSKKIVGDSFKEKDRFLTGVEKLEYSKQEQIDYTHFFYEDKIGRDAKSAKAIKRLERYVRLMSVTVAQLSQMGIDFDRYVHNQVGS